ncbi:hypothetical protein C1H46_008411 [Malus baccata]|uniref:Uncharacterized protein n=1 Tax=Malus baccata TaxID=106549 RepID=A0A540N4K3_MALBA|nr:hypothetical protein C1H46_008411 [Malus baccata]
MTENIGPWVLQDWAGHSRFIRVMPNTPSAVGAAASVLSLGGGATEQDGDLIAKVFGSIGKTWKADEKYFDAVTGLRYVALCLLDSDSYFNAKYYLSPMQLETFFPFKYPCN